MITYTFALVISTMSWYGAIYFMISSLSSAHYSPLLDIGISNSSPFCSIFGYFHPAPASHPAQIVTPSGRRASYTMFTETRSPLQNSFTPAVVDSTADMASLLPLHFILQICLCLRNLLIILFLIKILN
jgi:hypothetical protein